MSDNVLEHSIDEFFKTTGIGSIERAIGDNLYGIRNVPGKAPVQLAKDNYGYTFFTRPQLNLQSDNIRNVRTMYPLLTNVDTTIQRFVRTTLDPRLMTKYKFRIGASRQAISSPLVDNLNAFIPVLTNNIVSMSGFPDIAVPTYTSPEGVYGESQSMGDGITDNFGSYDVDATFRNTMGDPILYMMYIWTKYISYVFSDEMVPYPDFMLENEIDYNTRIYRLVLDSNQIHVTKIFATGASFPTSVPTGAFADFNSEDVYNMGNKEFTIRFKCDGFITMDDILIWEFNKTVCSFNPAMKDEVRGKAMAKVPMSLSYIFKNRCYPRIDPKTNELQWWVDVSLFNALTVGYLSTTLSKSVTKDSGNDEYEG
jgi:hypothetical protein